MCNLLDFVVYNTSDITQLAEQPWFICMIITRSVYDININDPVLKPYSMIIWYNISVCLDIYLLYTNVSLKQSIKFLERSSRCLLKGVNI